MIITSMALDGVKLLEPKIHGDNRGFFMESYNTAVLKEQNIDHYFIQDNHSLSSDAGVLRGVALSAKPQRTNQIGSCPFRGNIRCCC